MKVATRKLAQLDAAETLESCVPRPAIIWKSSRRIAAVNIAFASTINGASASDGPIPAQKKLRLLTTTEEATRHGISKWYATGDPGEVLREEFLAPLGMSVNALAKALGVPTPRINDVVRERRGVTPDTAMRLARYFGGDARSWLNLQTAYDLRVAELASAKAIERSVTPMKKAS